MTSACQKLTATSFPVDVDPCRIRRWRDQPCVPDLMRGSRPKIGADVVQMLCARSEYCFDLMVPTGIEPVAATR